MRAFRSRNNCFALASISSLWRSVKYFHCFLFEDSAERLGGGAVERYDCRIPLSSVFSEVMPAFWRCE